MASSWGQVNAKCPYYQGDETRRIRCESIIPKTAAAFWYVTNRDKERWQMRYCQEAWKDCPYAAALERNYE